MAQQTPLWESASLWGNVTTAMTAVSEQEDRGLCMDHFFTFPWYESNSDSSEITGYWQGNCGWLGDKIVAPKDSAMLKKKKRWGGMGFGVRSMRPNCSHMTSSATWGQRVACLQAHDSLPARWGEWPVFHSTVLRSKWHICTGKGSRAQS